MSPENSLLSYQANQVANLFVDFFRRGNGGGDFGPQQLPVAATQPVRCHPNRRLLHAESGRDFGVRNFALRSGQGSLELFKERLLSGGGVFLPQTRQDLIEDRRSPLPFEEDFGRCLFGQLTLIAHLRRVIDGQDGFSAAALLGMLPVPFVGQETLEHRQKERAKPAAFASDLRKEFLL